MAHKLTTILSLLVFTATAGATEVVDPTGEELYMRHCAACHGEQGKGDGPVASAIARPVPDLTQITVRYDGQFPRQMLKNIIDGRWRIDAHGTQQMPVWGYEFWITEGAGDFSEVRVSRMLDRLVAHLESIQAGD